MNFPYQRFLYEVYEDIFTDASWLYEQRLGFFADPNYQWTDFKPYETRLSNYLDALVNRNDSVETFCLEHAFDGESGDVFVAVYVLGKRKGLVGIRSLINDLDFSNIAFRQAFVDAVNLALDKGDQLSLVKQFFADNTPAMLEMAAKIAGSNRLDVIDSLLAILNQAITTDNPAEHELLIQATVIALGKIIALVSVASDVDFLYSLFDLPLSDDTLSELCITLLKAQHPKILSHCVSQFHNKVWPVLPLGLYGHSGANGALWQLLNTGTPSQVHSALLALGLLGNPDSIDVCIQCLAFKDFAESAANALQLITGANLVERQFMAEDVDPDELFPEELEKYEKGEAIFSEGEEPGKTVTQFIQQPEIWQQWFQEHKSQFKPNMRYRYGNVISKESLLSALKSPETPHADRTMIIEELGIQFGIDVHIEQSLFVSEQLSEIERVLNEG